MTVGDLQQYLRALAAAVATAAEKPAKGLNEAADALAPFARYDVSAFGEFLRAVEQKYGEAKLLPDAPAPKEKKAPAPRKPAAPKPPAPTVEGLEALMRQLERELASQAPPDRAAVDARLAPFEKLTKGELAGVVEKLNYKQKPGTKAAALQLIANSLMAANTASARASV